MILRCSFGWRTHECWRKIAAESSVAERRGVVLGGDDGDAEEVTDAAFVAVGGDDFVEDAVLAKREGGHTETPVDPDPADGRRVPGRVPMHEEVRVDRVGPVAVSVGQVAGDAVLDRSSQRQGAFGEIEATVSQIDQLEVAQLDRPQPVEDDQSRQCGPGGIGRVESGLDVVGIGGQWDASFEGPDVDAGGGVDEDRLVPLQGDEDRPQGSTERGPGVPACRQCSEDVVRVISRSERCPLTAHASRVGNDQLSRVRMVTASRGRLRGEVDCLGEISRTTISARPSSVQAGLQSGDRTRSRWDRLGRRRACVLRPRRRGPAGLAARRRQARRLRWRGWGDRR